MRKGYLTPGVIIILGLICFFVGVALLANAKLFPKTKTLPNSAQSPTPSPTSNNKLTDDWYIACKDTKPLKPNSYYEYKNFASPQAKLSISPNSGKFDEIGTKVLVSGSGWPANKKINIRMIPFLVGTEIPTIVSTQSDNQGKFEDIEILISSRDWPSKWTSCNVVVDAVLDSYEPYTNPLKNPIHGETLFINTSNK